MKLLYTSTAYPPSIGGAQIHHHLLAQQMARRHGVEVVSHWDTCRNDWLLGTTLTAPSKSRRYEIDGITVHRIGLSPSDKLRLIPYVLPYYAAMEVCVQGIAARFEEQISQAADQAEVIHNVRFGREALSFASWREARKRDIPFVLTPVHHPRWKGWRYRVYNELYRNADLVIALTEAERETVVQLGVAPDRVAVTGIGPVLADEAHPEDFMNKHGIDGPMILFLGQHYRYKGFQQLYEARNAVWQQFPDAHFVFIGPPVGNSESIFNENDRRIHRLGAVDLPTKTDALAAATMLCVPSSQESFGGVYTEAWSFGKPVIGCQIPAVADVISDGQNGLLVTQESAVIADRICQLLQNSSLADELGRSGKQLVQSKFTWDKLARKTENAYESARCGN